MQKKIFSHIFLLLTLFFIKISSTTPPAPSLPDRFLKPSSSSPSLHRRQSPQEYFELAPPLPSGRFPKPSCTLLALDHDFGNTIGSPPVSALYSPPPDCPSAPWASVVLELRASCRGGQYDRIAAVWLGGAEILRTSTAEPTEDGIFWKVRKDVTRYSSLLERQNLSLSMMLENVVNDVYTGVYHVELSFLFYGAGAGAGGGGARAPADSPDPELNRKSGGFDHGNEIRLKSEGLVVDFSSELAVRPIASPADLVIPISDDGGERGFWFRVEKESDVKRKEIRIPPNTRRAVLELYVSFHGDDEFWYSNPPDSYIARNNLTTGRGHGSFREVYAAIDGVLVASEVPFPVIFTGGINPLFWEPVVAIGAFDLPSYDADLMPYLGLLLDGKPHELRIGVSGGISFWLVDANLHLWLDPSSERVEAKSVRSKASALSVKRKSKFDRLDGSFRIAAKRKAEASGWAVTGAGNFTTRISREIKFKSSIEFSKNGRSKTVKNRIRSETEVRVSSEMGDLISETLIMRSFPLKMAVRSAPGTKEGTSLMETKVSHGLRERWVRSGEGRREVVLREVENEQDCGGWMVLEDHFVLSGGAETRQRLNYSDGDGCYRRTVAAVNGKVVEEASSVSCAAAAAAASM